MKVIEGEDSEEESIESESPVKQEQPQEIEGEDDEDDEEDEEEEEPKVLPSSTQSAQQQEPTTTITESTKPVVESSTNPTERRDSESSADTNTSSAISSNVPMSAISNSSDISSSISTTNPTQTVGQTTNAIVEGATRKLSTFWNSFKTTIATAVPTTTQNTPSTASTSQNNTTPNVQNTSTTDPSSQPISSQPTTNQTTAEQENKPSDTLSNTSTDSGSNQNPNYSTYFSGVLNKLKTEFQVGTLAEPVGKLRKALVGEEIPKPTQQQAPTNQVVVRVTHRMKELKQFNEQLEQTIHNKYCNAMEHIHAELGRLNNGMGRTHQIVHQLQGQLKRSGENLQALIAELSAISQSATPETQAMPEDK